MSRFEVVDDLADPRVAMFRNLKDRELADRHGLFVAEGEHLVRRLLASPLETVAVLVSNRKVDEISPLARPGVKIFSASDDLMKQIVGFKFHTGALACARRPAPIDQEQMAFSQRSLVVVCPEINSAENLGSIFRISAGFGAEAIILGPRCIDPYYRQAVRVSMGTLFALRLIQSDDLGKTLRRLRQAHQFQLLASVLDANAIRLSDYHRPARVALMLGSEAQGLDAETIALADAKVTIPMHLGTDSLNVAVAAGIFMYELMR